MKCYMTEQKRRPFNTGDWLVEVTAWAGSNKLLYV